MTSYDSDDSEAELLIVHTTLAELLQFVVARDEVRRISAPLLERDERDDTLALPSATTMPASGAVATKLKAAS